jgi:glycosyltransferase involved in cell wall biosynthesis
MRVQRKPLITIGMAFRNEAAALGLAIKSLLAQSYINWELLLRDDGSSDGSLEIARSFDDPRITVCSDGGHRALSTRLNECIKLAAGEYFARMDADDIAYPERFATQLRFLQAHSDVDLVATYVSTIDAAGKMFGKMGGPTEHKDIVKRAVLGFRMIHPTWLGRLSWFRRYLYSEEATYAQDQELLYRAYRHSRYAVIPEILLAYRQYPPTVRRLMRARIARMRYLGRHLHGPTGFLTKAAVAGVLSLKAAVDLTAVGTGLGYRILRHRALPVTDAELAKYRQAINRILPYPQ